MNILTAEIKDNKGNVLGVISLMPKTFSTGSTGYFGSGKTIGTNAGERLQISVNAVLIGSKPGA